MARRGSRRYGGLPGDCGDDQGKSGEGGVMEEGEIGCCCDLEGVCCRCTVPTRLAMHRNKCLVTFLGARGDRLVRDTRRNRDDESWFP